MAIIQNVPIVTKFQKQQWIDSSKNNCVFIQSLLWTQISLWMLVKNLPCLLQNRNYRIKSICIISLLQQIHECLTNSLLLTQATTSAPGYICNCNSGWEGANCDQNINECSSNPCQNGGTCTDGINGFTCVCTAQWSGPFCQTPQQGMGSTKGNRG